MGASGVADLPDEVLLEVFSRLPLADAVTCALHVCPHWRRLFGFRAPWRGRAYEAPDGAEADEAYLVARMLSTGRDLTLEAGNSFRLHATESAVTVRWDIFQQERFELLTAGDRVRSLSIPGDFLVWSNVTSLGRCTPQLTSLTVDNGVTDWPSTELSDALSRLLGSGLLSELRSLTVEGASSRSVEMDGPLLAACRGCPRLERLHLQWTERLGARGLAGLADLGALRRLRVSSVSSLPALDFLPAGLEELELSRCHGVRPAGLSAGPALRRLALDGCALEGERLSAAARRLASLREADLSGNRRLRDLSFLRPWVRLRSLNLADCDSFDGAAFGTLGCLTELRSLNLCSCNRKVRPAQRLAGHRPGVAAAPGGADPVGDVGGRGRVVRRRPAARAGRPAPVVVHVGGRGGGAGAAAPGAAARAAPVALRRRRRLAPAGRGRPAAAARARATGRVGRRRQRGGRRAGPVVPAALPAAARAGRGRERWPGAGRLRRPAARARPPPPRHARLRPAGRAAAGDGWAAAGAGDTHRVWVPGRATGGTAAPHRPPAEARNKGQGAAVTSGNCA